MSPNIYLGLYVDKLNTSYMPAIVDNIGIVDCNVKVLSCVYCVLRSLASWILPLFLVLNKYFTDD